MDDKSVNQSAIEADPQRDLEGIEKGESHV